MTSVIPPNASRELELVDGSHIVKNFTLDLFSIRMFAGNVLIEQSGQWWPDFLFFSAAPVSSFPTGSGFTPDNSILATMDGVEFRLYWDSTAFVSFTLTFLDVTWHSFWPYAADDASPIYDTATGLEVQDPRN